MELITQLSLGFFLYNINKWLGNNQIYIELNSKSSLAHMQLQIFTVWGQWHKLAA